MYSVLGFVLAAAIGSAVVLVAGRRGSARRHEFPWILDEAYKLHVAIVSGLAGFAFTGVVLVVALAKERAGIPPVYLDSIHFSLASTIEYRTVFLSWFALLPLPQANGLDRIVPTLYFSAALGTALTCAYAASVVFADQGARSPYSTLYLAVIIFCVNGVGFAFASLTPLAPRYAGVKHFLERYGRQIVVADMHLTMLSLIFLWLAVVGVI